MSDDTRAHQERTTPPASDSREPSDASAGIPLGDLDAAVEGEGPARRIGWAGTVLRVVVGVFLLYLAMADGRGWGLTWQEVAVGLGVLPAAVMAFVLIARRYSSEPLRLTGPFGLSVNTAVIIVLLTTPLTADAAALFYGSSLLVAAWLALPDCEATILSNLILRRDDQIGCPAFTPVDTLEARVTQSPATRRDESRRRLGSAGYDDPMTPWWVVVLPVAVCLGTGFMIFLADVLR